MEIVYSGFIAIEFIFPFGIKLPMKKGAKITLILVPLILVLLGSTYGVTLANSQNKVTYDVGDPTTVPVIIRIDYLCPDCHDYVGFIAINVPLEIHNEGWYNIRDLAVCIDVYGQNFSLLALNDTLLGQSTIVIGDVTHKTTWMDNLRLNVTSNIPLLALWDGELRIELKISLKVDFLVYYTPLTFEETLLEPWVAPF